MFLFDDILKGKIVIVGVGNTLRGDDGFGSILIEKLKKNFEEIGDRQYKSIPILIDAGNAPENYAGKIAKEKPDTILIVDAIDLGLKPGEYEIIKRTDMVETGFTTHNMSLSMFIEFLEKETGAEIYILGVQPEKVSFGEEMSGAVEMALEEILTLLVSSLKLRKKRL